MDKDTFKETVLPLKHRLYRLACSLLGDPEEAQDAVQEVFVRIWNKRGNMKEIRNMESFAVTITKNHCLDRLRKLRPLPLEDGEKKESGQPDPAMKMETSESVRLILQLMQQLPERQRMVMHLHDIEQMDGNEIAEYTGLSNDAIRANLSRARKKIRTLYTRIDTHGLEKN